MKPPPFGYRAPETLKDALDLLSREGDRVKILAGGQSLVPLMNLRLVKPQILCDINRIAELEVVAEDPDTLELGALTRHRVLAEHPLILRHLPLWAEAATQIGHPPIRSRGTLGGSLSHADPAAELCTLALISDAEMTVQSARRVRRLSAPEFFVSYFTTALEPDDMLTAVRIPKEMPESGTAWVEFSPRPGDFALAGAAIRLIGTDRCITAGRVGLLGAGPFPMRSRSAEAVLSGSPPGRKTFSEAAHEAAREAEPPDDLFASSAYRRHLLEVLVRRGLEIAAARMER